MTATTEKKELSAGDSGTDTYVLYYVVGADTAFPENLGTYTYLGSYGRANFQLQVSISIFLLTSNLKIPIQGTQVQ